MAMNDAQTRLLEGLNEDLRGEFQAIIMYRLCASMVQGPYRQELRNFFAAEIPRRAQPCADAGGQNRRLGRHPLRHRRSS